MTTPKNKDRSVLYAILAGAALFGIPTLGFLFLSLVSFWSKYVP